jgi:hypothetical protein
MKSRNLIVGADGNVYRIHQQKTARKVSQAKLSSGIRTQSEHSETILNKGVAHILACKAEILTGMTAEILSASKAEILTGLKAEILTGLKAEILVG